MIQKQCISSVSSPNDGRFKKLRGVRWRINLGILPSSPSTSIDELRRVTADSRRKYAALRRRILVDPHVPKEGRTSPDLGVDNPLSQNPDSHWSRFFHNAELEKTLDQDLSRLYPEHCSYFQSSGCQGLLRRILLLWCLRHPKFGYRQGMHELLAPLLYVLHVDVEYLSQVRKAYEDHFNDLFDELALPEHRSSYNFDFKKFLDSMEDSIDSPGSAKRPKSLDELDPDTQTVVLLSDAYGAEGELGILLSEKFMEHDAYSMFDALMNGSRHSSVSVSDFFAYSLPSDYSTTGRPPVIEASAAVYYLLSLVDDSLHTHLVELGVEPQYFALRWLRVLFGREFCLSNLLIVWDEIFCAENSEVERDGEADQVYSGFSILSTPRGALITGMAVSMMLYLRSSLLASETATSSLQKLLNLPEDIDLRKIIDKAKLLQALALEVTPRDFLPKGFHNSRKSSSVRRHSLSLDSLPFGSAFTSARESYWEEKWRVLNNNAEEQRPNESAMPKRGKLSWSERVKLRLYGTESDAKKGFKGDDPPARPSLLDNLSPRPMQEENSDEGRESLNLSSDSDESISDKRVVAALPPLVSEECEGERELADKTGGGVLFREKKVLSGKQLQRFLKFGKNGSEKEKRGSLNKSKGRGESLRTMADSMLQHLEVIESALQRQELGKGQCPAMEAVEELRRLSYVLSEL